MVDRDATSRRIRRTPKPLDRARLEELALGYVARFATSSGKLETYLDRKIRERGWDDSKGPPHLPELVERFVAKGYIDDASYGEAKSSGLLARGYGARRIEQSLRAAGLDEGIRADLAPDESLARAAALALARRRLFGPFAQNDVNEALDWARKQHEKQLAAMLRAGHQFDHARRVIEAQTVEELEEWVAQAQD